MMGHYERQYEEDAHRQRKESNERKQPHIDRAESLAQDMASLFGKNACARIQEAIFWMKREIY